MLISGQSFFTSAASTTRLSIAEQPVHLGALGLHDQRAVGVREREVPVLREHEVEVELGREPLVELHALRVERGALRSAVVGPDDGRVAAGRAGADVALLDDRHVGDAVVLGEVVRRGEPVRAAADDDDVVVALELARPREDLLLEEDVLHAPASERVDADRARRRARRRGRPRPRTGSGRTPAGTTIQ